MSDNEYIELRYCIAKLKYFFRLIVFKNIAICRKFFYYRER